MNFYLVCRSIDEYFGGDEGTFILCVGLFKACGKKIKDPVCLILTLLDQHHHHHNLLRSPGYQHRRWTRHLRQLEVAVGACLPHRQRWTSPSLSHMEEGREGGHSHSHHHHHHLYHHRQHHHHHHLDFTPTISYFHHHHHHHYHHPHHLNFTPTISYGGRAGS